MPTCLGGVSVCVCFMAAVVSLGLTLVIVPRQVTPWTGLLLFYEWAFIIFFILFGGYLNLIYHWGRITASRTSSSLSQPESSDDDSGKRMFPRSRVYFRRCVFHLTVSSRYFFFYSLILCHLFSQATSVRYHLVMLLHGSMD